MTFPCRPIEAPCLEHGGVSQLAEPDWAGPGFSTPFADPELEPEAAS